MRTIMLMAIILASLIVSGCVQKQPVQDIVEPDTEQCYDSLQNIIVRPSQMELPMLWTDTIYDTCYSHRSMDGRYIVFIGRTEEDKLFGDEHLTVYGNTGVGERNSVFLYDNDVDETTLLVTTSQEGYGVYMPQIDIKNELVYYLRETDEKGRSFMRYNLKTKEEENLTDFFYTTVYKLMPNGNILFQDVREDVLVSDTSLLEDKIGCLGYVFCDIEMTPEGICVNKSRYYDYDDMEAKTGKTFDVSEMIILNNEQYKPRWEPSDIGNFNRYYDKKGNRVGTTHNTIESYDGWIGMKLKEECP